MWSPPRLSHFFPSPRRRVYSIPPSAWPQPGPREFASARKDADTAKEALENRTTIERAKGILMRRTGSSEQEAYRILQRTSQDRSVPMVEIAKAVLASEPGSAEH